MPVHHRMVLWISALMLIVSGLLPVPAVAEPATKLYIGHFARFTAEIPRDWTVVSTGPYDYAGAGGFVANLPVSGQTLDDACASVATSGLFTDDAAVTPATWSGEEACRIDGDAEGRDVSALVVPHPHPFTDVGKQFSHAAVVADPDHLDDIVATLDFSPDRVTPEAYVTSVLDIIEARAFWSDSVDWGLARQQALAQIDNQPDIATAHVALWGILGKLRAGGDNHSFFLAPDRRDLLDEGSGFGLLIGGQRVLVAYPDGPAYRAGVRAGDVIEKMNGQPLVPIMSPMDPAGGWEPSVQLTLRRPGQPGAIAVTIEQGPFSRYLSPTGRRLANDIGYIAIPGFTTVGRETEYAAVADRVIAAADQPPTCGWVVDLRLNTGGSYSPMVTGVGPILGDGTFLGWRTPDGRQLWVSYQDGSIYDDGPLVADELAVLPVSELQRPNPPVAVLTGPLTGSSGEVATLAFVGRSGARLFGERTGGFTTGNSAIILFDGAWFALAEVAMTDRTGATHMAGVEPDEPIAIDWTAYGTDEDPVLNAATEWLDQQPACANATPAP